MKTYAHHGFTTSYCAWAIAVLHQEYSFNYEAMNNDFSSAWAGNRKFLPWQHEEAGFSVTLADNGLRLHDRGRIRKIRKYIGETPFSTYGRTA